MNAIEAPDLRDTEQCAKAMREFHERLHRPHKGPWLILGITLAWIAQMLGTYLGS